MSSIIEKEKIIDKSDFVEEFDDEIIDSSEEEIIRKRSRMPIYITSAIILVSALVGLGWWLYARQFVTTDDSRIEGNISVVSPKITAHVAKIHFTENRQVKKGDLLIEFDSKEQETKLLQAQAALQTALAGRTKAYSNVDLTRQTSRAGLDQASSNLRTAQTNIEQSRIASSSKENLIEQARRQSATAEANLRQVQSQIPAAEAAIEQARARVKASQSRLDVARFDNERDKNLFNDGIVSRQKYEQTTRELSEAQAGLVSAEKDVEITQSRLNALRRQIDVETSRVNESKAAITAAENDFRQSQAQVGVTESQAQESAGRLQEAKTLPAQVAVQQSEVEVASAQIEQAQAAVNQAELELSYTKIYAPQDGFISRKAVQEGQLVQAEQALFTITQGEIWVVANFKETQIEKMKVGQSVDIYVDAYPSAIFRGRVESFQAGTGSRFSVLPAENASGNFVKVVQRIPVKIVFDESPDTQKYLLVPGMSVVPKVRVR